MVSREENHKFACRDEMKIFPILLLLFFCSSATDSTCIIYACNGHSNMKYFLSTGGEATFLNRMEAWYPGYRFKVIDGSHLSCKLSDIHGAYVDSFVNRIERYSDTGIIAGLILMFGYVDGRDSASAYSFSSNMVKFISTVRTVAKCPYLPVFLCRYEKMLLRRNHKITVNIGRKLIPR